MAKSPKSSDIELHHDGWQRFERAMAVVVKSPPQHRTKSKVKPRKSKKAKRG